MAAIVIHFDHVQNRKSSLFKIYSGWGNVFATSRSSSWIVLDCILFVIALGSCCITIGDLTRDCLMFLKGRQVSRFRCFVFEIWLLSASVFIFECFVFKTTMNLGTELGLPLDVTNITHRARGCTSLKPYRYIENVSSSWQGQDFI